MLKGGRRPGAGRPKGALNRKTRATIAQAERQGIMPLDVMLSNMRGAHARVIELENRIGSSAENGDLRLELIATREVSQACAKDAAPYVHPKLSSVEQTTKPHDFSKLTDAELDQLGQLLAKMEHVTWPPDSQGSVGV